MQRVLMMADVAQPEQRRIVRPEHEAENAAEQDVEPFALEDGGMGEFMGLWIERMQPAMDIQGDGHPDPVTAREHQVGKGAGRPEDGQRAEAVEQPPYIAASGAKAYSFFLNGRAFPSHFDRLPGIAAHRLPSRFGDIAGVRAREGRPICRALSRPVA
jgi:hypothetical protein